mmetsp:Transcript_95565/g.270366  ORF Transcript_95565/g.270366 Transcript_95565/m.270366 type:complete len:222 (-) Transcript_95565:1736-2401(-)
MCDACGKWPSGLLAWDGNFITHHLELHASGPTGHELCPHTLQRVFGAGLCCLGDVSSLTDLGHAALVLGLEVKHGRLKLLPRRLRFLGRLPFLFLFCQEAQVVLVRRRQSIGVCSVPADGRKRYSCIFLRLEEFLVKSQTIGDNDVFLRLGADRKKRVCHQRGSGADLFFVGLQNPRDVERQRRPLGDLHVRGLDESWQEFLEKSVQLGHGSWSVLRRAQI